jgi:hypothetical protein
LAVLFGFHFFTTLIFRLINSTYTIHKIRSKKWGYNTLLIGTGPKAIHLISDLETAKVWEGFIIKGFVQITEQNLAETGNIKLDVIGNWNS